MSTLFNENDQRLLDKTLHVRERIIDNLIKGELPTKACDILAITGLLESTDKSIMGKAKLKIEEGNSKTNEETKELMKELMLNLHKNPSLNTMHKIIDINLPVDIQFEITSNELVKHIDPVSIKDFN